MRTAPPRPIPVPADIDIEERLIGPLTPRQCAILAVTAVLALGEGELLRSAAHLAPVSAIAAAAPLVLAGMVLALARPGGVPADRLLRASISFLRSPRRRADVPEHLPLPAGVARLAPLYRRIDEVDGAGVLELDGQQAAVVIAVRPRCVQLADGDEARGVLAGIGTILAAQTGPFSITTLTERVSLDERADLAAETAEHLATPQLAHIALRQAGHLRELADGREVWHRRHLITIREAGTGAGARAVHRARATAQLCESCGITARVLDPAELTALLTAACDPQRTATPARLAPPGRPVTALSTGGRR
jgi:hypothetical protein